MIHNSLTTKNIKRQFIKEDRYQNSGYYKNDNDLTELPEDEVTWLRDIIEFFDGCGGCRQY